MTKRFASCLVFLFAASQPAFSVMHIVPGAYPNARRDDIHHPSAAQMRAAGGSVHAATISSASGTKNVAVILVGFAAPPPAESGLISGSSAILNVTNIQNYFTQMQAYYTEISYGKITLNFDFFNSDNNHATGDLLAPSPSGTGVYTLAHTEEYYGCGDEGVGCSGVATPAQGANGNYLIRDAIIAARSGPNAHAGLISRDNGGTMDAIIVVHAGNGNETTRGTNGDIWSIFYSQDTDIIGGKSVTDPQPVAVTAGFSEGDVVPETETSGIISPLGVMCHEFGHSLGLPDLYNTSVIGGSSVVGKWEIMDSGPYLSAGTNPSHMGAWDKMILGWVTPTVTTSKLNTTLSYVETNPSMLKIPVQNGGSQEYFLVEYRATNSGAQYDRSIPGSGLLIWHIDDAITSTRGINASVGQQNTVNSGIPHYGVSIVAADGSNVGQTGGAGTNVFVNGQNFTDPKSANFAGQPSGINLLSLSGVGTPTASMFIEDLQVAGSQSIVKLVNYPNPAGKGYPHPNGEGHTTIQMQLSRPPSDIQINIYTLSGDLVRKLGQSEILHNDRSDDANFKFVYEYIWDLKNGDGNMVAPGVYLLLGRADGQSTTSKAVIIR